MIPNNDRPILVLWDIDGTVIHSGGAGKEAIVRALRNYHGIEDDLTGIEFAGRTDLSIFSSICHRHQDLKQDEIIDQYLLELPHCMSCCDGRIIPGVVEVLEQINSDAQMHNGLLTGNVEKGARIKLGHFDLNRYFNFGAFGDHHLERGDLLEIALKRAYGNIEEMIPNSSIWVIGDTPYDIACAKVNGCRSLAVGTGFCAFAELEKHSADCLVKDLTDTNEIMKILRET